MKASSLHPCSPAQPWKHVFSYGKGKRGLQPATELGAVALAAAAMVQHTAQWWSFCKPCLGTPASDISQLAMPPFRLPFLFTSLCDSPKPDCTHVESKATCAMLNLQLSSLNLEIPLCYQNKDSQFCLARPILYPPHPLLCR